MDKDIQKNLLNDLKEAKTVDEKVDLIIVFLEYLGEWNLDQVKINDSVSILNGEQLKSATAIVERLIKVEKFLDLTMKNTNNNTNHIADLYNRHNKVLEDVMNLYKHG